jgi:CheY-like chemotaxis protein
MVPTSRSLSILVVDDDPFVRNLLTVLFQREGWRVVSVGDGRSALSQIEAGNPDAIVLDLLLPGMTGTEILERLKESDGANARTVVLTAVSDRQLDAIPPGMPISRVLRKPFDNQELVSAVRTCAEARASYRAARSAQ